jgi:hypothetical protein
MKQIVKEVISRAADRLSVGGQWTQGCAARDSAGKEVDWYASSACSWCIYGAICEETRRLDVSQEDEQSALKAVEHYLYETRGGYEDSVIASFNDAPERTAAECVALLREVIA